MRRWCRRSYEVVLLNLGDKSMMDFWLRIFQPQGKEFYMVDQGVGILMHRELFLQGFL